MTNSFNATGGIPLVFVTLTSAGLTQAAGETATASQQTTFEAMTQFVTTLLDPFISGRGDIPVSTTGATPFAKVTLRVPTPPLAASATPGANATPTA